MRRSSPTAGTFSYQALADNTWPVFFFFFCCCLFFKEMKVGKEDREDYFCFLGSFLPTDRRTGRI